MSVEFDIWKRNFINFCFPKYDEQILLWNNRIKGNGKIFETNKNSQ